MKIIRPAAALSQPLFVDVTELVMHKAARDVTDFLLD